MSAAKALLTHEQATRALAKAFQLKESGARSRLYALIEKQPELDQLRGEVRTRRSPRIVESLLLAYIEANRPKAPTPLEGDILSRLAKVEDFVAGRRFAEESALLRMKAEIENLREELGRERELRAEAQRTAKAVADRLFDLGIDVDVERAAGRADRGTLLAYADVLTELLIPGLEPPDATSGR